MHRRLAIGDGRLREVRDHWPTRVVATEDWPPNVPIAAARLRPLGAFVVQASTSASAEQPFRDLAFDLVLARHSSVPVSEVARLGFDVDTHLHVLNELEDQDAPIDFGISRSLLIARRP